MGVNDGSVSATVKLVDNGPDEDKWNLVITGDGFTLDELDDFVGVVDDFVAYLQTVSPFTGSVTWEKVNVHRIDVVSNESGADSPNCDGTLVDTYFDATFCANNERTLVVDETLVIETANDQVPEWDALLVFVNSEEYGGAARGGVAAASRSLSEWTAVHELGHAAFGLADEYDYSAGCDSGETGHDTYTGSEPVEPNITTSVDLATLGANQKWAARVDAGTPLPTTENPDCTQCDRQPSPVADGTVGLFEGAGQYHCGLYRPEYDCRMRTLVELLFCAVCIEEILFDLTAASLLDLSPCLVATAVYGDPHHPDVATLRCWRDRHLEPGARGAPAMRLLVAGYAQVGPVLARLIQPRPRLTRLLRILVFGPWARALRRREGTVR
jgi:IgA Peptidase M64